MAILTIVRGLPGSGKSTYAMTDKEQIVYLRNKLELSKHGWLKGISRSFKMSH